MRVNSRSWRLRTSRRISMKEEIAWRSSFVPRRTFSSMLRLSREQYGHLHPQVVARARGAHLQASLGVDDSHPLKSRSLRNYLEHFDEKLDDWAESSINRNMADQIIVPRRDMISFGTSGTDQDILRLFETDTANYIFRGEEFNLREICGGVENILCRAKERVKAIEREKRGE